MSAADLTPAFFAGFTEGQPPTRVRFGRGLREDVRAELDALGCSRALILTTPEQVQHGEDLVGILGELAIGHYAGAVMHTPVETTEDALREVVARGADVLIAIGGGSTIGLGKAIAYRTDLPQIVLPTTYAGSEATAVLGQTENGVKSTLNSPKVQPEAILYDPELIAGLPVAMTVTSGLNAMAHAVEALYANTATPLSRTLAMEGLRAFVSGLPQVVAAPDNLEAREATLYGAWLCGTVLNQGGMALHHKLCHTLGGMLNLPHAATHAILLPHATGYNDCAALAPLAELLGAKTAGQGLYDFAARLGAPKALQGLRVQESDLDIIADQAVKQPYPNPRPLERDALRRLLQNAFEGNRPETL